jgi:hypothetical protein
MASLSAVLTIHLRSRPFRRAPKYVPVSWNNLSSESRFSPRADAKRNYELAGCSYWPGMARLKRLTLTLTCQSTRKAGRAVVSGEIPADVSALRSAAGLQSVRWSVHDLLVSCDKNKPVSPLTARTWLKRFSAVILYRLVDGEVKRKPDFLCSGVVNLRETFYALKSKTPCFTSMRKFCDNIF